MNYFRSFIDLNDGNEHNSFYDSIKKIQLSVEDIDTGEIADFLIHGWYYFEGTPLKNIKKKFGFNSVLDFRIEENFNQLGYKEVIDLFISSFGNISEFLKDKKLSVDLTGGVDSRLVAVLLKSYDLNFDCIYSLISGSLKELEIVKKVAEELKVNLHVIGDNHDITDLEEVSVLSDGLTDIYGVKSLLESLKFRKKQGYDLTVTGVGGELYKDFFWQQDFPFYGIKKPNLKRLVNTRMYPCYYPDNMFRNLEMNYSNRLDGFIDKLSNLIKNERSNIYAYDKIYTEVRIKEQVTNYLSISNKSVPSYSPLLEPYNIDLSKAIPPSKKWFNLFHRDVISILNKNVSKVPTFEGGGSVSNSGHRLVADSFLYSMEKSKKLLSRFMNNSESESNSVHSNEYLFDKAIAHLIALDIVDPNFKFLDLKLNKKLINRIISVHMMLSNLGYE